MRWQAITTITVGIAIGIPAGLLIGRWTWQRFAGDLGVGPEVTTPVVSLAAVALRGSRHRAPRIRAPRAAREPAPSGGDPPHAVIEDRLVGGQARMPACFRVADLVGGEAPVDERGVGVGAGRDRRALDLARRAVEARRGRGLGCAVDVDERLALRRCAGARAPRSSSSTGAKHTSWPAKNVDPLVARRARAEERGDARP